MPEARRPNPLLPVLVAWLLPGAGHLWIRKPWPAVFVAGAILPLFAGGLALAGFANVNWERHPWLFGLQGLTGLPAAITSLATRGLVPTERPPHPSVGDLFTCVAGLLNLVAIADVWARCSSGDPEERLARHHAAEDAAAEPTRPEALVVGGVASGTGTAGADPTAGPGSPEAPRG